MTDTGNHCTEQKSYHGRCAVIAEWYWTSRSKKRTQSDIVLSVGHNSRHSGWDSFVTSTVLFTTILLILCYLLSHCQSS